MKKKLLLIIVLLSIKGTGQVYKNLKVPLETRVKDLFSKMTFDEKLSFINGTNWMYTKEIKRLNIPADVELYYFFNQF